jgi:hypothetical protein
MRQKNEPVELSDVKLLYRGFDLVIVHGGQPEKLPDFVVERRGCGLNRHRSALA